MEKLQSFLVGLSASGQLVKMTHHCPGCGTWLPLPEYAGKHCPNCGQKQSDIKQNTPTSVGVTCPKCGKEHQKGKYCIECGTPLTKSES